MQGEQLQEQALPKALQQPPQFPPGAPVLPQAFPTYELQLVVAELQLLGANDPVTDPNTCALFELHKSTVLKYRKITSEVNMMDAGTRKEWQESNHEHQPHHKNDQDTDHRPTRRAMHSCSKLWGVKHCQLERLNIPPAIPVQCSGRETPFSHFTSLHWYKPWQIPGLWICCARAHTHTHTELEKKFRACGFVATAQRLCGAEKCGLL